MPAAKRARKSAHARKRSATPTVRTRKSAAHGFGIAPLDPRFSETLLLSHDERPAYYGATDRTPAAKCLVNLGCHGGLLSESAFGFDLRVGDVSDRNPARGFVPHLFCDEPKHRVSHFRRGPPALQMIMIVGGVKSKEIRRQHRRCERIGRDRNVLGCLEFSFGNCPALGLKSFFAVAKNLVFGATLE